MEFGIDPLIEAFPVWQVNPFQAERRFIRWRCEGKVKIPSSHTEQSNLF